MSQKPTKPKVITILAGLTSRWREIKIYSRFNKKKDRYDSYAYIVTEAHSQGLQVADLSDLPERASLICSDLDVDSSIQFLYRMLILPLALLYLD